MKISILDQCNQDSCQQSFANGNRSKEKRSEGWPGRCTNKKSVSTPNILHLTLKFLQEMSRCMPYCKHGYFLLALLKYK